MSDDHQFQLKRTQEELQRVQAQLQQAQSQLQNLSAIVAAMRSSKFWKLRDLWFKLKQKLGSSAEPEFSLSVQAAASTDSYLAWTERNFPRPADVERLAAVVELFKYQPQLSIIMPVYNTPQVFLSAAIESVLNQIYPRWELCIVDDASTLPHVRPLLETYAEKDDRIKLNFKSENGHIVQASNCALELATGEFIVTLDHDDLLTPDALYEFVLLLNKHPQADFIYSDQDMMEENNQLTNPFFKPDWCPDSFLSHMYTCHLSCYRRSLVKEIGGYRPGFEGSQDYDLVLRLTERTDRIFHISKVLYHWRIHSESVTSAGDDVKSYAYVAAQKAIAEALDRRGEPGDVLPTADLPPGSYTVRYKIKNYDSVQIIIFGSGTQLDSCLTSIFAKSTYPNYQVTAIRQSCEETAQALTQKWLKEQPNKIQFLTFDKHQNSTDVGSVVAAIDAKYLLFLSSNLEVVTPDWIEALVEQAQRSSIGAVGARLFHHQTVRHAGILVGVGGIATYGHQHFPSSSAGYANQIKTTNNYSAVSGDCLMCRRELFEQVGGYHPELKQYGDVDLCLKFVDQGYRNVYLPHVILHYSESGSDAVALTETQIAQAENYMRSTWPQFMQHDPCYNPNLTKANGNYSFNL